MVLNLDKNRTYLLACSGGVDSMVLAHLLYKNNYNFAIAHCNFCLRNTSYKEEVLVINWSKKISIPYFIKRIDTEDYMQKTNENVQLAARNIRYKWFHELVKETEYKVLLTAHHAQDNLETLFLNLGRGAGIKGFLGIQEKEDLKRPLLNYTKKEIYQYAQEYKIPFLEDKSNKENNYKRNKIRNLVMPNLLDIQPNFLAQFSKNIAEINNDYKLFQSLIEEKRKKIFEYYENNIYIEKIKIKNLEEQRSLLYHLFSKFGFQHPQEILKMTIAETGKKIESKTHILLSHKTELVLKAKEEIFEESEEIFEETTFSKLLKTRIEISNQFAENSFDYEKLIFPLNIRKWNTTDVIFPTEMKGSKKVSKLLKDAKLNKFQKEKQMVIVNAKQQLITVLGLRTDRRFITTNKTTKFYILKND